MAEDLRSPDTEPIDLEGQYYRLFEQKVLLERELVRSTRGLSKSKEYEENFELRRQLIVTLEDLFQEADRLAKIFNKPNSFSKSYREWAAAHAGEVAYHKEMLELQTKDPTFLPSSEVILKALAIKKAAADAVKALYSDAA